MKIKSKKLSKSILIAGVTLSMTRCAYGFEDTLYKMFEQTDIPRNIKFETTWEKVNVTKIIEQSLECSKNLRKIFEEIADDEVGRLTLRAFYQGQKNFGKKLRIIEDRPFITPDDEEVTNIFIENDFAIYLNLEKLQKENITTIGWCNGRFQYNPINCGLFEANRQHKAGIPVENIVQRILHKEYNAKYEKLSIQYIDKVTTDFKKIFVDKNI